MKPKKAKDPLNEPKQEESSITSQSQLKSFLKTNKDHHYNFEESVDYKVSSGSLLLDYCLSGGLCPGLHRFTGINEGGKEQPISEPILTPSGWVGIGSVKVGDEIIGSDGNTQKVLGVFPQGIKDVYEVSFSDGCKVRCGIDHLWETSSYYERSLSVGMADPISSIRNLRHIIDTITYNGRNNHSVRLVGPVRYDDKELPIDPYLLGILISNNRFSDFPSSLDTDAQIWEAMEDALTKDDYNISPPCRLEIAKRIKDCLASNGYSDIANKLKFSGLYNIKKARLFIPKEYITSSVSQRIDILSGFIDSNTNIFKDVGNFQYNTCSKQLCLDIVDIARSLGGHATMKFHYSTNFSGEKGSTFPSEGFWQVEFFLPYSVRPYHWPGRHGGNIVVQGNLLHFIADVILVGKEESVCIKVSNKDSLYVTRDYVLTHNTSAALQFLNNFLPAKTKRKGVYIKAEGRLSKEMIDRSGVKFVFNEDEWVDGTCFVFESNIYETVVDLLRDLVGKNSEKINYFFILDSVDGLIRKGDLDKSFEDSAKVAGGAVIAADFMKRVSISLQKRGHIAIFISQVRADIKLDPYSKAPVRQTSATGGNALLHFANWILEFEPRFNGDLILTDEKEKYDERKNPFLGHLVKVLIKKSPNEKTNSLIKYPIKYGRKNGTSNWIEKEILDFLLMWELVSRKGPWLSFEEDFLSIIKDAGFTETPAQIQGVSKFEEYIDKNDELKKFFFGYIRKNLLNISPDEVS